jgi:hypothetical protein
MIRRTATWLAWPVVLIALGTVIDTRGLLEDSRFAVSRRPELMPSTLGVPREYLVTGQPLLSVYTWRDDLHDPVRGILVHPLARGRTWERFAYASYFENAVLRFATGTGLRVHGGRSREWSVNKSFGLFFRYRYGSAPDASLFFSGPSGTVRRIVVHNDIRNDRTGRAWHFINPLAYDIAARIGAIVPRTRPIRFILNGELQGAYVLTEHIGPEFLEARFGHGDFGIDDTANPRRVLRWARGLKPMTAPAVSEEVDLQNLTSWALSYLFCGTTDVWQGVLARDQRAAKGRWFWINWDMDHSFMDLYQRAPAGRPWEIDTYRSLLGVNSDARSLILTRLLKEDDSYRRTFAERLVAMLNHDLTPRFLRGRLEHYRLAAAQHGVKEREFLEIIEAYFAGRPAALLAQTRKYLGLSESAAVVVTAAGNTPLLIDGRPTPTPYEGRYFPETPIQLEVPAADRERFDGWSVNGKMAGRDTRIAVSAAGETRIEARFRP